MIDPFTALGAASSIFQFVEFGGKLLIEGYGLYRSKDGVQKEFQTVQELTEETEAFMEQLSTRTLPNRTALPNNASLQNLATKCRELAQELLDLLHDLKLNPNARHPAWESLRKVVIGKFKAREVEKMRQKLVDIHTGINTFLLDIMRYILLNRLA